MATKKDVIFRIKKWWYLWYDRSRRRRRAGPGRVERAAVRAAVAAAAAAPAADAPAAAPAAPAKRTPSSFALGACVRDDAPLAGGGGRGASSLRAWRVLDGRRARSSTRAGWAAATPWPWRCSSSARARWCWASGARADARRWPRARRPPAPPTSSTSTPTRWLAAPPLALSGTYLPPVGLLAPPP